MSQWRTDYVMINKFSRPGNEALSRKGVVLHWTANPGATDENHAEFFDGKDGGGSRAAGAHIFVDRDSATLIVPLDEIAYHANEKACKITKLKGSITRGDGSTYKGDANVTTIGVEMCVEKNGTIHPDTVKRTVEVIAELCRMYKLGEGDIYRHYDVTGKACPKPFVDKPELFEKFKNDVAALLTPLVSKPSTETKGAASKAKTHKVVAGDTMWGISRKYGLTKQELQSYNPDVELAPLQIGAVLKVAKPERKFNSLVDYLSYNKMPHDFVSRVKLANKYGIIGYSGTASQNTRLLNMLQND